MSLQPFGQLIVPPASAQEDTPLHTTGETTFRWATVTDNDPLTIKLDGDTDPLGIVPDSLVDPLMLAVDDRVWVQLFGKRGRRVIILGVSAGPYLPDIAWTNLSLQNSWVTYGGGYVVPRYCRRAGIVYVQGLAKDGTGTSGTVVSTLPAGCRPSASIVGTGRSYTTSELDIRVDVGSDGNLTLREAAGTNYLSLWLPPFPAEQ